jgi:GntR family transcriptional regulator/MocR family aminotransferase
MPIAVTCKKPTSCLLMAPTSPPLPSRLPSTRALAAELGVSRNVIMMAFEQLRAEGYLESRVGSGSFVATTLPDVALAPWRGPQTSRPSPVARTLVRARGG